MKCPKCQSENDSSLHYCQECGEYLHTETPRSASEAQTIIKTVKVVDTKKLLKSIFSTFLFTAVTIGGYSLFQVHQIQSQVNEKVEKLEKKNKEQKEKIETLSSQMDKSSVDYEKEIVELEKEKNELDKQVTDLEKEVQELNAQLEELQNSSKKTTSDKE